MHVWIVLVRGPHREPVMVAAFLDLARAQLHVEELRIRHPMWDVYVSSVPVENDQS